MITQEDKNVLFAFWPMYVVAVTGLIAAFYERRQKNRRREAKKHDKTPKLSAV
jgi:cytochrome c-type biogenesis protein CcmH/NrfF